MNSLILVNVVLAVYLCLLRASHGHYTDDGKGVRWMKHDEHGAHEGPVHWKWDFVKPQKITAKERVQYEADLNSKGHKNWPSWAKDQKCHHAGGYPHPKGDCTKFVICKSSGAKPQERVCKGGKLFDPFEEKCKKRADARPCSVCLGKDGYTIPDPEDEHGLKFYQCSEGLPHHYQCMAGKFYHPISGKCEQKQISPEESIEEYQNEEKEEEIPDPSSQEIQNMNRAMDKNTKIDPLDDSVETVVDKDLDLDPWKPTSLLNLESEDVPGVEAEKDILSDW